jgi:hypothetical protein
MTLNLYQWAVLAALFALAVNEIRLSELNNTLNYSSFRVVGVYLSCIYVAFAIGTLALKLFLTLGQL